jgi:hypothetical protein
MCLVDMVSSLAPAPWVSTARMLSDGGARTSDRAHVPSRNLRQGIPSHLIGNVISFVMRSVSPALLAFRATSPVRRAERRLAMATATKKARATVPASRGMQGESVSMEFVIVEDNGGKYHWTLLDRKGNSLARSPRFPSYGRAEDAARVVLAGSGSAQLDRRAKR